MIHISNTDFKHSKVLPERVPLMTFIKLDFVLMILCARSSKCAHKKLLLAYSCMKFMTTECINFSSGWKLWCSMCSETADLIR